jgi:cysteine-rich repeat protein
MRRALSAFFALALAACGAPPPEDCANLVDDDSDGFTDCQDLACQNAPACAQCGDGRLDPGEDCDGDDLAGQSCASLGFDGGILACDAACALDTSGCTRPEDCTNQRDDDADNLADCQDPDCADDSACTFCGDGITNRNEECDDGNSDDSDECLSTCSLARCGDGFLRQDAESCDDGNTQNGDGCDALCQVETSCGDGILDPGEDCDDGNTQNGDGCDATCGARCGDGFFIPGEACYSVITVPVGFDPSDVALGDLDQDGDLDAAIAHQGSEQAMFFYLEGGLVADIFIRALPADSLPGGLALGDLDQDGDLDAAVTEAAQNRVRLLLNPGDGRLDLGEVLPVGFDPEQGIIAEDLNSDGILDLAVVNTDGPQTVATDTISVFFGLGGGLFSSETLLFTGETPFGLSTIGFAEGLGLVSANFDGESLSVFSNDGAGSFSLFAELSCGDRCAGVASGDFDQDGRPDLAAVRFGASQVALFHGQEQGFSAPSLFGVESTNPFDLVAADTDGDGLLDLATSNLSGDDLSLLVNQGGTSFRVTRVPVEFGPTALTTGELNGDGRADFLVANRSSASVSFLLSAPF